MKTYWLYLLMLDPFTLAIQGGTQILQIKQDGLLVDWSIGQSAAFDLSNGHSPVGISNGFLQNKNCDKCLYKSLDSFLVQLKYGPNPIGQFLNVQLHQAGVVFQGWEIYSLEGRLIQKHKAIQSGLQLNEQIDFSNYSKGLYVVKFYFLIDQQFPITRTFQLFKT